MLYAIRSPAPISSPWLPRPQSSRSFSSTLPPPPTSTLFPYTTLFRSRGRGDPDPGRQGARGVSHLLGIRRCATPRAPDRKSTRLNSSHVEISYAVFCLKKKTSRQR